MKLTLKYEVEAPEGATHWDGDPSDPDTIRFFKKEEIGAVGDHWFIWKHVDWVLHNHKGPPSSAKEIDNTKRWVVWNNAKTEGVIFDNYKDAMDTQKGYEHLQKKLRRGFMITTLGESFTEYQDKPLHLEELK
jgi:hypothetical protein